MDGRLRHMRPGQHNKRGRNRNRHRGGGGGGGGNGNSANKVYDSNGPDVKLRGTAQTVAEKYMQLGRDAQSSGDIVMAESYYQFADHYYRVWLAAQPVGQPIHFSRRPGDDDMDDEAAEGAPEGDEESQGEASGERAPGAEAQGEFAEGEQQASGQGAGSEDGAGQQQGYQNRPRRDFQQRDGNRDQNREGGNRFRNRWGRRNDRQGAEQANGEAYGDGGERQDRAPRADRPEREARPTSDNGHDQDAAGGNWEAPSFLKRPMPATAGEQAADEGPVPERPARGRRARSETPSEDVPRGE